MADPAAAPRFYLEEVEVDKHIDGVHALYSKQENLDGFVFNAVTSRDENLAWLRKRCREWNPDICNFAIMVPVGSPLHPCSTTTSTSDPTPTPTPLMIGLVGIIRLSPPELGYIVARPFWGRGVANQAAAEVLRIFFARQPSIDKVFAYIDVGNEGSRAVARKIGFVIDETAHLAKGEKMPSGHVVEGDGGVEVWVKEREMD